MAVPKFITNDMKGGYVGGPTTPARRCYVGGTLVYQGFGPASEREFVQLTAPGGPAQLLKVYGKTIVNNQLVKNGDFSDGMTSWYYRNSNVTIEADGTIKVEVLSAYNGIYQNENEVIPGIIGHKYLMAALIKTASDKCKIYCYQAPAYAQSSPDNFVWRYNLKTITSANKAVGVQLDEAGIVYVKKVRLIDLTTRFGAGNEPTSVDEALRLLGGDAFDPTYDPGSLQSNKTAELRAYDGGTLRGSLQLNLSTLTGKLNGEGASVVVYPDGLRGVGTDRDAAYGSTGEVARAVVDLGMLNWSYSGEFYYATLVNSKSNGSYLLSSDIPRNPERILYGNIVRIYATNTYTDAAAFKAAMSGVMLDYPLATPLTYTLDTPLPTDLTCEQGDILKRVSGNNCPFVGEMRFGL